MTAPTEGRFSLAPEKERNLEPNPASKGHQALFFKEQNPVREPLDPLRPEGWRPGAP